MIEELLGNLLTVDIKEALVTSEKVLLIHTGGKILHRGEVNQAKIMCPPTTTIVVSDTNEEMDQYIAGLGL